MPAYDPISPEPSASRPHMPGYGILDADAGAGLLPWSWAVERLSSAHNYWLATTRPDGAPHLMPVWGVWQDGAFYFSTSTGSRKARNLAADPRCVISTDMADEAVILEGVAEEVVDTELLQIFKLAYDTKYAWEIDTGAGGIYAVRPTVAFAFIEKPADFPGTATRWEFAEG